MSIVHIKGCLVIICKKYCFLLSEIFFTFTNSVDPDEMQHCAAFHLDLHCLQKYSFSGFPEYKGFNMHAQLNFGTTLYNPKFWTEHLSL